MLTGMGGGGGGYAAEDGAMTNKVWTQFVKTRPGQEFTITVGGPQDDLEDVAKEAALIAIIESFRPDFEAIVDFVAVRSCVTKIIDAVLPRLKIPNGNIARMELRRRVTGLIVPYVPAYWQYDFLQHLKSELRRAGLRGPRI